MSGRPKFTLSGIACLLFATAVACTTGGEEGMTGPSSDGGAGGTPSDEAPSATIVAPDDGESFLEGEEITFEGSAEDPEDGALEGGSLAWESDLDGQIGTGRTAATASLSVGEHTVTLTATDSGANTTTASISITVEDGDPSATITAPPDGASFTEGDPISFDGSGDDPQDGTLTGGALVWQSDLDGQIGTGGSFTRSDLSPGDHTITLTATDSDGNTGTASVSIAVESAPSGSGLAYVLNGRSADVSVIDVASNTVVNTIDVGVRPTRIALSPDGATAYILDGNRPGVFDDDELAVVDVATGTVEATVAVPAFSDVAVTPDGEEALVSGVDPDTSVEVVWVIDLSSNVATDMIPVGNVAGEIAIAPNGALAYVVNRTEHTVSVIDIGARAVSTTIALGGPSDIINPIGVTFNPDGNTAYVTFTNPDEVGVIDVSSSSVTATISAGDRPVAVDVTPDGSTAYVTNLDSDDVSVIDVASGTVTTTISVGSSPQSVAVSPDGGLVYVVNFGSNTVSVIDVATNSVTGEIPVGNDPQEVAFRP